MKEAPKSTRYFVACGVVGGASVTSHLARLNAHDMLLLERTKLSAGTTWHATGNMEKYRADALIYNMVRYARELYQAIAAENIRWRQVDGVIYTNQQDRWESFRSLSGDNRRRWHCSAVLGPEVLAISSTAGLFRRLDSSAFRGRADD